VQVVISKQATDEALIFLLLKNRQVHQDEAGRVRARQPHPPDENQGHDTAA